MTLTIAIVAAALALLAVGLSTFALIVWLRLRDRLNAIWTFLLRASRTEAVERNVASNNSPLRVLDEATEWLDLYSGDLQEWYQTEYRGRTDGDLVLEVATKFGAVLLKHCQPRACPFGAMVIVAASVAKDERVLLIAGD